MNEANQGVTGNRPEHIINQLRPKAQLSLADGHAGLGKWRKEMLMYMSAGGINKVGRKERASYFLAEMDEELRAMLYQMGRDHDWDVLGAEGYKKDFR